MKMCFDLHLPPFVLFLNWLRIQVRRDLILQRFHCLVLEWKCGHIETVEFWLRTTFLWGGFAGCCDLGLWGLDLDCLLYTSDAADDRYKV